MESAPYKNKGRHSKSGSLYKLDHQTLRRDNFARIPPMFWQSTMLSMLAMVPAVSGWLGALSSQGTLLGNFLAIDILICLGIFLLLVPTRPVAWVIISFLLTVWWIGQSFGGVLTFPGGTATDFNSAPLFILFLLPIFLRVTPPPNQSPETKMVRRN